MSDLNWTNEDSQQALAEGWDLFDCGDPHEPLELQRLDVPADDDRVDYDEPKFPSDVEAWRHVARGAQAGNPLHLKALNILREVAPKEYSNVMNYLEA